MKDDGQLKYNSSFDVKLVHYDYLLHTAHLWKRRWPKTDQFVVTHGVVQFLIRKTTERPPKPPPCITLLVRDTFNKMVQYVVLELKFS